MGQSLYLDPNELRGAADELRTLAEDAARTVAGLKSDLIHEGECWGDDEPGTTFAESYVAGADHNIEGFHNLVHHVRAVMADLHSTAAGFENGDRDADNDIRGSSPTATKDLGAGYPSPSDRPHLVDDANRHSPDTHQRPERSPHPNSASPVANDPDSGAQRPATSDSPSGNFGDRPDNTQSNGTGSAGPDADQPHTPSRPASPSAASSAPIAPAPRSSTPGPSSPAPTPNATRRTGRSPTWAPDARPPGRRQPSTPPRRNSGVPWSKSGHAPEQQSPPRIPPRIQPPQRPATPKPPLEPAKRQESAPARQPVASGEAMGIITALAVRHNLRVIGFESSGIATQTAQEIADAVDTVLTEHSLPLHGIEIGDDDGDLSRVENRSQAAAPEPWIVVNRRALTDTASSIGRDRVGPEGSAHRPMYSRMLREFGRVTDLVGAFAARKTAQRTLITEYLRLTGVAGRTLPEVTDGYRCWRDQLGGQCFRDGVLDPGPALAEGFAAVEHGGGQAPGPAKVLHRLLLVMAGLDMR